ncbi:MAG: DUF748 domain-containing protein [Gammaproteobacteria bacterium]|nr:DUF748 domain-containing protein [Gammaproteobacteria bacterium]
MRLLPNSRWFRIAAIGVLLVAAYAAAGFWVVPRVLRAQIVAQARERLGLVASVGPVRFNPFSFQLQVAQFALTAPGGQRLAGFDTLSVDFRPSALLRREYAFRSIDLAGARVNAVVAPDGRLNLSRWIPAAKAPTPAASAAPAWPRIRVDRLRIEHANLRYEDRAHPGDFTLDLAPAGFELTDFTTRPSGGAFAFHARTPAGERIDWHGRLAVAPLASEGELRIEDLRAATVDSLLRGPLAGRVAVTLTGGRFGLDVPYRFAERPRPQLRIDGASASAAGLGIAPVGSSVDEIRVAKLDVAGGVVDLDAHRASIARIAFAGLTVDAALDANGQLNLARLTGPAAPAPASSSAARWTVDAPRVTVSGGRLSFVDRRTAPAAKFVFTPLSLRIDGASLDASRPVRIALSTGVDGRGEFAARGTIVPAPLAATLDLRATHLDLSALQPYVAEHSALTVERGDLGARLALAMPRGVESLSVRGDLRIDGLHTTDDALRQDLVDWQRLDVRGMRFSLHPARLAIARIAAVRAYARVIIEPDGSLNVKRILTAPGIAAAAPSPKAGGAKGRRVSATHVRVAALRAAAASRPLRVTVARVDFVHGEADFSDLSITPNFTSGISDLNGDIRGLDSVPGTRAKVDLKGEVGPYAPVSIDGALNLFGPKTFTDLAMNFRNMDLTIFNPYSGKFAGYDIRKGKLTTELHYRVRDGKLDASHHVVIDQLEFGAKTHSKDATTLPVKLAVALLKDRHGVIDLDIPVTGSLNDPQFRLAPLIWKVVVNLIAKAVTAPFKLLGALFGAGPQIQYVDFRAGDATLDATDLKRLQTVARALQSRPLLKVDVPIASLAAYDAPALADERFDAEVAEQMLGRTFPAVTRPGKKTTLARALAQKGPSAGATFAALGVKSQVEVLAAMYRGQFHADPVFPRGAAPAQADAAKLAYLETQLRDRIHVGPEDLKVLAERRALAIEKALLDGTGVDPARVFLVANGKVAANDQQVRLQLSLR